MQSFFSEVQFKYIYLNNTNCFGWAIAEEVIATLGLQHSVAAQLAIACITLIPDTNYTGTCSLEDSHEHIRVGSILTFGKIEGQLRPVLVEQW
ncbi:MAG TPA: hypothetical protein V6D19_01860 [Stenomitos sp.]